MDFKTFVEGFKKEPPDSINMESKPVDVLMYAKHIGFLAADTDFLSEYVKKHTPDHPDEWEVDEDCIGEIEDFILSANREKIKQRWLDEIWWRRRM